MLSDQKVGILLRATVGALLVFFLGLCALGWYSQLKNSYDNDKHDRWGAHCAYLAVHNGEKVGAATTAPYQVMPYPPLGYVVNGAVGLLLGDGLSAARAAGRCVSLVSALISAACVCVVVLFLTKSWTGGLLAGLLFLLGPQVHQFAVCVRPSEMAQAFTMMGIVGYYVFETPLVAGFLFGMAIGAKHSFVVAPLTILIFFLAERRLGAAARFVAGGVLAIGIIVFLGFHFLGPHWMDGLLVQNETWLRGKWTKSAYWLQDVLHTASLIPLTMAASVLFIPKKPPVIRFFVVYFASTLLLQLVLMTKLGAASDYMLEPLGAACILSGWVAANLHSLLPGTMRNSAIALLIPVLGSEVIAEGVFWKNGLKIENPSSPISNLMDYLKTVQGPVLSSDSRVYFEGGYVPWCHPVDMAVAAAAKDKEMEQEVAALIQGRYFGAIVFQDDWKKDYWAVMVPKAWLSALETEYVVARTIDGFIVYVPR